MTPSTGTGKDRDAPIDPPIDPLRWLADERTQARSRGDAMANLACLATAQGGQASARMLVLRDFDDTLALFFSGTSPKEAQLHRGSAPELLVYLPSLNVQYRLRVTFRPLERELLRTNWQKRPVAAKHIDWFYNAVLAQGTAIGTRDELKAALAASIAAPHTSLDEPPAGARGYYLDVLSVERLHIQDADPPHDRRRFERFDGGWRETVLVP